MKKIRIGNDFVFTWAIERDGLPENIAGSTDRKLLLRVGRNTVTIPDFQIVDTNKIVVEITPQIANQIGDYIFTLHYRLPDLGLTDEERDCAVDTDAFTIVPRTAEADDSADFSVSSDMAIAFKGDAFIYEDFTPEQIEDLKQPARDAADSASQIVAGLVTQVDNKLIEADQAVAGLTAQVNTKLSDADLAVAGMEGRVDGKILETNQVIADVQTVKQETLDTNALFASAEALRETAEDNRELSEAGRVSAESERVTAEQSRTQVEALRVTAEQERVTAELNRQAVLDAKVDKTSVKQTTGTSETDIMSQKAVTDELALISDQLTEATDDLKLADAMQVRKISDIENVISTANINQTLTNSVSGYGDITLPKTASNAGMQVRLEGLTAENLVVNGDFRNGLTGWNKRGSHLGSLVVDGVLNVIATADGDSSGKGDVYRGYYVKVGKYYSTFRYKNNGGDLCKFSAWVVGVNLNVNFQLTEDWVRYSIVADQTLAKSNYLHIYAKEVVNGANFLIDDILIINLTETFGAGNEPTKQQCDLMFAEYFEGVKSFVPTGRIRSVGRNVFNKARKEQIFPPTLYTSFINENGRDCAKIRSSNTTNFGGYMSFNQLKEKTSYTVSFFVNGVGTNVYCSFIFGYSDGSLSTVNYYAALSGFTYRKASSLPDKTLTNIYLASGSTSHSFLIDLDTLQLEEGTVATPYVPFSETAHYLTGSELKSNKTTKDLIKKNADGYEFIRSVGVGTLGPELITAEADRTFSSDTGWWIKTGWIIADGVAKSNGYSTNYRIYRNEILTIGKVYMVRFDILEYLQGNLMLFSATNSSHLYLGGSSRNSNFQFSGNGSFTVFIKALTSTFALSSYDISNYSVDNVSIREVLNSPEDEIGSGNFTLLKNNTLLYALTNVKTIPITSAGTLRSEPDGTVYHEPVLADAVVYGTQANILNSDYPISSLENIIKHENGVDLYLSTSSAVIAADGLSFTHPDLVEGDLVMFTYFFEKESTKGLKTLTYFDSRHVIPDASNGNFYKWDVKSANGVPSIQLTQV